MRLFLCLCAVFLASCSTTLIRLEGLADKPIICDKLISKTVVIVHVPDNRTEAKKNNQSAEIKKEIEDSHTDPKLDKMFVSTNCILKVRVFQGEVSDKDFDRIIKVKTQVADQSAWEISGRTLWVFASASTLFIVPYTEVFEHELTLEDSKTGFTKKYRLQMKGTLQVFYFFKSNQPTLEDGYYEILNDFFNELRAKS